MATQYFFFSGYTDFYSDDGWDIGEEYGSAFGFSRMIIFVDKYGIQKAAEQLIEDDAVFYNNDLHPVSAVFHSQADGRNRGDAPSSEGTTVQWE